jgi:hypothetical protein
MTIPANGKGQYQIHRIAGSYPDDRYGADYKAIPSMHSARMKACFWSCILSSLMDAGVKRRENGDEYIALTLAPDAQDLMDETSLSLQQQMKPGGALYHYDDIGARFIEQSLRIAGIFRLLVT